MATRKRREEGEREPTRDKLLNPSCLIEYSLIAWGLPRERKRFTMTVQTNLSCQFQPTANQVTLTTTSRPRSSAPGYLNVHIPSRLTSQKAPCAECMPRLPILSGPLPVAAALSSRPCWTMVLFTVKRYGGGEDDWSGAVASIRAFRIRCWTRDVCFSSVSHPVLHLFIYFPGDSPSPFFPPPFSSLVLLWEIKLAGDMIHCFVAEGSIQSHEERLAGRSLLDVQ